MSLNRAMSVAAALFAAAALSGPSRAAEPGIKIGVLRCFKIPDSGYNLLIRSVARVNCRFVTKNGTETYKGETGIGLGIDLEWDEAKSIAFTVFSATSDTRKESFPLSGRYVGAKASASAGYGVGLQSLVGAGDSHITLQPLAIEETVGVGFAAGLSYLYLEPDR